MQRLLERSDGPAIRDTLLWFALLGATSYLTIRLWGSWWAALPYALYAVLYASVSDSRWHESGHGTAFRTDWMNEALYEMASFMVLRESTPWRWSHVRHHSDTSSSAATRRSPYPIPQISGRWCGHSLHSGLTRPISASSFACVPSHDAGRGHVHPAIRVEQGVLKGHVHTFCFTRYRLAHRYGCTACFLFCWSVQPACLECG